MERYLTLSEAESVRALRNDLENERVRLSNWINDLSKRGEMTVDNTLVLRHAHVAKAAHAIGLLYGELLTPTEGKHA